MLLCRACSRTAPRVRERERGERSQVFVLTMSLPRALSLTYLCITLEPTLLPATGSGGALVPLLPLTLD